MKLFYSLIRLKAVSYCYSHFQNLTELWELILSAALHFYRGKCYHHYKVGFCNSQFPQMRIQRHCWDSDTGCEVFNLRQMNSADLPKPTTQIWSLLEALCVSSLNFQRNLTITDQHVHNRITKQLALLIWSHIWLRKSYSLFTCIWATLNKHRAYQRKLWMDFATYPFNSHLKTESCLTTTTLITD